MADPMLEVNGLRAGYGPAEILFGVSLRLARGEVAALMRLVAGIARSSGIGVLFTEHDMDAVFAHADRILVLVRGEIIAAGTPEDVRANPEVQRVYLGTSGLRAALRARAAAHG